MELTRFNELNSQSCYPRQLPDTRLPLHSSDPHISRQGRAGPGGGNAPLPAARPFRLASPAWGCSRAVPSIVPRPAVRTQRRTGGRPGPERVAYLHGYFRGRIDGQGGGRGRRWPEVQHGIAASKHDSGALGAALVLGLRVGLRVGTAVGGERGDCRRHLGAGDDGTGRSW